MSRITRHTIQQTRLTHIYIYGDDKTGKAMRGQASVCWNELHCLPIWTRVWPCSDITNRASQWLSSPPEDVMRWLERDCFEPIRSAIRNNPDRTVVIFPKIGEGCSCLRSQNPIIYKFIQEFLDTLRK